jgi:CBS domain-containing protein
MVDELRAPGAGAANSKLLLRRLTELLDAESGSLFLLDEDGLSLRGALGMWDWTRAGFDVRLDLWPTVRAAISTHRVTCIAPADAEALECDWFECDGIAHCICAPMVCDGRAVGVLFVDFATNDEVPSDADLELVRFAAEGLARSFAKRLVSHLTRRAPLLVDFRVRAEVARRLLHVSRERFALVVRDGGMFGVVSRAALDGARPGALLETLVVREPPRVREDESLDAAAQLMLESGADCLPVMGNERDVVGLLTRHDLRAAEALPGARGIDLCVTCGATHELSVRVEDAPVFCSTCLGPARLDSIDELYATLGGGD